MSSTTATNPTVTDRALAASADRVVRAAAAMDRPYTD